MLRKAAVDTILLLGQNLALLFASAYLYGWFSRRIPLNQSARSQLLYGLFFGSIALIGMQLPLELESGVIMDGRVVVVSLSALFGGAWASLTAGLAASIYCYTLGGPGVYPGIAAILLGALTGIIFMAAIKGGAAKIRAWHFIMLGGINSILGLTATHFLPDWNLALRVVDKIFLPIVFYYPLCSLLLGYLFLSEIRRRSTERALLDSEEHHRLLVETTPNGVIFHHNRSILLVNPAAARLLGAEHPDDLLGRDFYSLVPPKEREKLNVRRKRILTGESIPVIETRFIRDDGSLMDVEISGNLVRLGEIRAVQTTFRDISAHKKAQQALLESEERFRSIVDTSHDGIIIIDDRFRITYSNPEMSRLTGYAAGELNDASPSVFLDESAAKQAEDRFSRRMAGEDMPTRYQFKIRRKDGVERWVELSATVFDDSQGHRFNVAQFLDITGQKTAQANLKESEARYRLLTDQSLTGVFMTQNGRIIFSNQRFAQILGHRPEDILGHEFWSYVHPGDQRMVKQRGLARSRGEKNVPFQYEFRIIRKNGQTAWLELLATRISLDGAPTNMGNVLDITARKAAEKALQQSEERYRSMVESDPNGVICHRDREIILANPAAARMLAASSPEQLLGMDFYSFVHPSQFEIALKRRAELLRTGVHTPLIERRFVRLDGEEIDTEVTGSVVTLEDGPAIQSIFRDITERKRAQQELAESERRFSAAFHASPLWVAINTVDQGRYLEVNQAFCTMTGYTREEVLGRTAIELGLWPDPSQREPLMELFKKQGSFSNQEVTRRYKDGSIHTLLWSADPIDFAGQPCMINSLTDITGLKRVEKELLRHQEHLEELVKERTEELRSALAEKEVLLREIHHRVKNNMAVVSSLLNMQANRVDDASVRGAIRESQERIRAMAMIHETLYQSDNLEQVGLQGYIQGLAGNLLSIFHGGPSGLELNIQAGQVSLQISQAVPCGLIINELLTNALKYAFPHGGPARIDIKAMRREDGWVSLSVGDNGAGLPEGLDIKRPKTLGLRLISLMVEQLHGEMSLKNQGGALFELSWPLHNP
jgi:PAS domain S-box-containing protein